MKTFPTNKHMNYAHTSIDLFLKFYIYYISVPVVVAVVIVIPVVP